MSTRVLLLDLMFTRSGFPEPRDRRTSVVRDLSGWQGQILRRICFQEGARTVSLAMTGLWVICPSFAIASTGYGFLASAAFLLKNRRDAIFCKVLRK